MAKIVNTRYIDNLLDRFGKDRKWLATLLGYTEKELSKIVNNDKTTYGDLQQMFLRGNMTFYIYILNETIPSTSAPRLQFLKNNFKLHRNPDNLIQNAVKRSNVPFVWWEKDDIPMIDLLELERNLKFKLQYQFNGFGDEIETVDDRMHGGVMITKSVSTDTLRRYQTRRDILQTLNTANAQESQKTEQSEPANIKMNFYIKKEYVEILNNHVEKNNIENFKDVLLQILTEDNTLNNLKKVRRYAEAQCAQKSIYVTKSLALEIKKTKEKLYTTNINVVNTVIGNWINSHPKAREKHGEMKVKGLDGLIATARANKVALVIGAQDKIQLQRDRSVNTHDETKENQNIPTDKAIHKAWNNIPYRFKDQQYLKQLLYSSKIDITRIDDAIMVNMNVDTEVKCNWIKNNALSAIGDELRSNLKYDNIVVDVNYDKHAAGSVKPIDDLEIEHVFVEHEPEDKRKERHTEIRDPLLTPLPASNPDFEAWIKRQPVYEIYLNEIARLNKEDNIKGLYAENTICALRPFEYPKDAWLISLSNRLKEDIRSGSVILTHIVTETTEERNYIHDNNQLCEQVNLMNETYDLIKERICTKPVTLDVPVEREDDPSQKVSSLFFDKEEGLHTLYVTSEKKGLFGKKKTQPVKPTMFSLKKWLQIITFIKETKDEDILQQIFEHASEAKKALTNKIQTLSNDIDVILYQIIKEIQDTKILQDFEKECSTNPEIKKWENMTLINNEPYITEVTKEGRNTVPIKNYGYKVKIELAMEIIFFISVKTHPQRELTSKNT